MNYNKINDIYDIDSDNLKYIQNDDNMIVTKIVKFFNTNQQFKIYINFFTIYYRYVLFKTKYNNFYINNFKIYNNLLLNTDNNLVYSGGETYKRIIYKPNLNNSESDNLESYYNQKAKLEIYFIDIKIKINCLINLRINENISIHTENKYIVFIKYIELDKKIDKKFIALNNGNYSIIYKLCENNENNYIMYLYKIKNTNTYDELLVNIDYENCENIIINIKNISDSIYKFLPNKFILYDNNYEYLGNIMYYVKCEKYLVSRPTNT